MKAFIVLLAAAFVAAEPQMIYGNGFYHHPLLTPLTYVTPKVEVKSEEPTMAEPVKYVVKPYAGMPTVYNTPSVYSPYMYTPYAWNAAPVQVKTYSDDSKSDQEYAGKGTYYAESAGAIHKAKREAEADPAIIYSSNYPAFYNYAPAVASYSPYAAPLTYVKPEVEIKSEEPTMVEPVKYVIKPYAAMPTVYNTPSVYTPYMYTPYAWNGAPVQVKTYSDDSMSDQEYASKGTYYAESAGAIHKAKREAEADPAIIYSSNYPAVYNYAPAVASYSPYAAPLTYVKPEVEVKSEEPTMNEPVKYVVKPYAAMPTVYNTPSVYSAYSAPLAYKTYTNWNAPIVYRPW